VLETVPFVLIDQVARPAIVDIFTQALKTNACNAKTSFQAVWPALLHYQYLVKHAQLLIL
jgi:hypothetical protein